MGPEAAALRQQLLDLPEMEREELAMEMLASLPAEPDEDLSDEWIGEIKRRVNQVVSGEIVCDEWEVVERRLLGQLHRG